MYYIVLPVNFSISKPKDSDLVYFLKIIQIFKSFFQELETFCGYLDGIDNQNGNFQKGFHSKKIKNF